MICDPSIVCTPSISKMCFFVKFIITKQHLFSQTDEKKCWFVRIITIKLHTHL